MARRPARSGLRVLATSGCEWAIFSFCRKTLARSTKHRLFLATWLSAGIAAGMFVALSVRNGKLEWSPEGLRTFPFLLVFFVVSGFRTAFQFPADLACNWLLQITESRWAETSRRAARKLVLVWGLVPLLVGIWPFEAKAAGPAIGTLHILFQLTGGALLSELMFWKFGKVPFTCTYFAGKTSLSILAVLYFYGFTTYSFNMADLEQALERNVFLATGIFGVAITVLAVLWRRRPEASEVVFDGSEPLIQTLDLY